MDSLAGRVGIVMAILRKDAKQFSRDRLYIFISLLGLVAFATLFWVVPGGVDQTIVLGVHVAGGEEVLNALVPATSRDGARGVTVVRFDSADQLRASVNGEIDVWRTPAGRVAVGGSKSAVAGAERLRVEVGIALPGNFVARALAGEQTTATVFSATGAAPEVQEAMGSLVRELAYRIAGRELPVTLPAGGVILGQDRSSAPVSMRDRMRPLLAFFVLMVETFSLGSLIAGEVMGRTVTAVLVTPARLSELLVAKTIYGTLLGLSQGLLLLVAVNAFTATNWPPLLLAMLLGGVMFTGVAMVVGASGKDFLGTLFYGLLLILPLAVPAVAAMFPGSVSSIVKVLPTYGIVEVLRGVTIYEKSWAELATPFGLSAAWVVVIYLLGLLVLRRKIASL